MPLITTTLLIVLAIVVVGGAVYILRPSEAVDLSVATPVPSISPIDNTIPFPPPTMNTSPEQITPISTDVPVTLKTNKGDIKLVLHGADAPGTVGNFVKLAQEEFYDGTAFHRVIPDFMIQGGDPLSKNPEARAQHGTGDPGYKFKDEINARKMVRGVIAMANSGPNTNGSQFFIVMGAAFPHLDGRHTVFGEVVSGMDIVDAISQVPKDARDNPIEPVVIEDVVVEGNSTPALKPLQ